VRQKQQPFDLKESELKGDVKDFNALTRWLCDELQNAIDVRSNVEWELDYFWRLYEQARTRLASHMPWPDAADLTSPLATQYVDSFHARAMQTIFGVDKVWSVEGWGNSVAKAPFVEEFHRWTFEDERGQSYCDQAIQNSWIDGVGILEVSEATDVRPVRRTIKARLELDPLTGAAVFDEQNNPRLVMENGAFAEVPDEEAAMTPFAEQEIDDYRPVRIGPEYDVIDYRDFYVLPRHARSRKDVWGYAKRFYRTVQYLRDKAEDGMYEGKWVASLHDDNERETDLEDTRKGIAVQPQDGPTAQKELYEISFLKNLDGKGLRWWTVTLSLREQSIGRLKYDDFGTEILQSGMQFGQYGCGRYVRYIPFPRKNQVDRGLSLVEKILTLIEEHTAVRNMRADRASVANNAPVKRLQNALWSPQDVPWGPKAVIDVRQMDEVQQVEVADVPASINDWEQTLLDCAERTIGMTDIASGVESNESRTLGERQLTTGFSQVRVDLPIKRLGEPMEDLWQIRHVIWKRCLASQPDGIDVPQRAMYGLEQRGVDIQQIEGGKFTADLLDGKFRGKPYGSVDTANPDKQRGDWNELTARSLPALMALNPMVAAMLQTPEAARSMLERTLDVHGVKDKQPFLGMGGQSAMGTAALLQDPTIQQALQPPMMGAGGAALGTPAADPAAGGVPAPPPPMPQGVM
jgi:hypothetical protein